MANAIVNQKYNPYYNHDEKYYAEEANNTERQKIRDRINEIEERLSLM